MITLSGRGARLGQRTFRSGGISPPAEAKPPQADHKVFRARVASIRRERRDKT